MSAKLTKEILEALKHVSHEYIWATEPQIGPENRRIDFWTLHPHRSRGYESVAYEIKTSRGDFRRDNDMKQRTARLYSDKFYYVTPVGLVKPDEIPDWAGLKEWHGNGFATKVHAPSLPRAAPTWDLLVALLRASDQVRRDASIEMKNLNAQIYRMGRKLA